MGPPSMVPLPNASSFTEEPGPGKKRKKKPKRAKLCAASPQTVSITDGEGNTLICTFHLIFYVYLYFFPGL